MPPPLGQPAGGQQSERVRVMTVRKWKPRQIALIDRERLRDATALGKGDRVVGKGGSVLRLAIRKPVRVREQLERFRIAELPSDRSAQQAPRDRALIVQCQGTAERCLGRRELAQRKLGVAHADVDIEVAAVERECALEACRRILMSSLSVQNDGEIEMRLGTLGRRDRGAAHPGFRLVELADAE